MSAAQPLYRLKLYGHVTSELEKFAQQAAGTLRMSRADVERLMVDLPVVLKQNLGQDAAELLKMQLDAIGGLTIMEPMEETGEEILPTRAPQQVTFRDRLTKLWSEGDEDPEARVYVALLIGATILLSSIITFGYSASLVKLFRQDAQMVNQQPTRSSAKAARLRSDGKRPSSTELLRISSRIDELRGQIQTLRDQHSQADKMLQRVNTSFSANRRELFERSREVADLRKKIREAHSEMKDLRRIRGRAEGGA